MAFSLKSFFGNLGRGRVRVVDAMHDLPTQANIPDRWSNRFMGPGSPLGGMPTARGRDAETEPRTFQYPTNVNATIAPRAAYNLMPFTQLREYAEAVPEVAECIRIITEELKAFKPRITEEGNEVKDPSLDWMIDKPDRFNPWPVWLSRFLYNMLVYDAGAVHTPRAADNSITALRVIDGSTLFLMVDEYGELPTPPAPAFSQVLYGVPRNYFNTHQIWYRPRHLRADAPYGRSPIEDCLPAVRVLAKMWGYQESWYTEGTTPDTMLTSPEKWTPEQILQFESDFNARMAGNTEERAGRIRFLPPGVQSLATKEATFNQAMYDAAANSVRMSFGIPRTEFGESPASGLGGSGFLDAMQDVFYRTGLSPVKAYIEGLFDYALEANGHPNYKFELAFPKESIDPKKEEDRATDRFVRGVSTRDETREKLGMKPLGGEEGAYLVNPSQSADEGMSRAAGIDLGGTIPVRQDKIPVTNKIPVTGRMIPVDEATVDVREPIEVRKALYTENYLRDAARRSSTGVAPHDDAYFGSPVNVDDDGIATVGATYQVPRIAMWMPGVDSREEAVYLIDRALAPNDQRYLVPVTYAARIDDVDGLVVLDPIGARKPPANVGRFDADWVEQAAVLDYICAVNRDDFQLAAHPGDPDRPILTTTGGAFTTSHSPFVREWAGKDLSGEMMHSLHAVGADSVLWRDIEDCIGKDQAAAARDRVNVLAQAGRIPPEAA